MVIERFATDFDGLPEVIDGAPSGRMLIAPGLLVQAFAATGCSSRMAPSIWWHHDRALANRVRTIAALWRAWWRWAATPPASHHEQPSPASRRWLFSALRSEVEHSPNRINARTQSPLSRGASIGRGWPPSHPAEIRRAAYRSGGERTRTADFHVANVSRRISATSGFL